MPRLSPEQKSARRLGIGSSDVAELLGISPYEGASPVRLFAEKTGMLPDDDEEETIEQAVGHALEGALVALYERESKRRVITTGGFVESVTHPTLRWAKANLDGRIADELAALEVKAVGIGMASDWDLHSDDGIPHYVRVQVVWQMFVANLDAVHVVALVAGPSGFRVYYVLRDLELEAIVVAEVTRWWEEHVVANVCPALDASKASRAYLNAKYPAQAADVEAEVPEELVPIGLRRLAMARLEKEAEEAKEIANAQIIEAMGKLGATKIWCGSWRASYRADKNGQRSLLVKPVGEVKVAKPRKRSAKDAPAELAMPSGEDAF